MSNLRLLLGLEPFKKFVVGGGGWWVVGGGGWLRVILVLSLRLKLNNNLKRMFFAHLNENIN